VHENTQNILIKTIPKSSERLPLFIVGDVHGCAKELELLVKKAKEKVENFQLLLVGDLFTKGPDPVGVLEMIEQHNALCIKGNHDWALWSSIIHAQKKGVRNMPEHTQQTLHFIRYHKKQIMDLLASLPHCFRTIVEPKTIRKGWENSYPMGVVHAGIDPLLGLENTPERVMLTARYMKWEQPEEEKKSEIQKKLVLIPSAYRAEILSANKPSAARINPSINPSMTASAPEKFRWHELYKGPELLVFGHDAKQGLFRKTLPSGRPICIGIDTGCTYGKSLTGYFPEWDDAIQVQAIRPYFDLQKNIILSRNSAKQAV
jgi:bis(5'-nucleosyl)-tetraphosphatase (symmetrical)